MTVPELKIVYVSVTDLKPHPKNPRCHTRRQIRKLAQGMTSFEFNAPILADGEGTILAGHARWAAAKLRGLERVPVIYLSHLDKDKATAFMLSDNKLAAMSSWDEPLLAEVLKELSAQTLEFELEDTGFETTEIDLLTRSLDEPGMADTVDEYEVSSGPAVTQPGEGWQLGENIAFCGSALDGTSYRYLPPGEFAAMAFMDPPYNVPIDGHVSGLGQIKHREFPQASGEMTSPEFMDFLKTAIAQLMSQCAPGALIYACMDWRHEQELRDAAKTNRLTQINLCVWVKTNGGMGSLYRSRHELVLVFRNGDTAHRNNVQLGRNGRNRTNVWEYPGANVPVRGKRALEYHPTPKPVTLVADAILDCTRPRDFVIDPFLGSGTTLLSAERTIRRAYGIELDPLYVDTTVQRWEKMTGRSARLVGTGKTFSEISAERAPRVR